MSTLRFFFIFAVILPTLPALAAPLTIRTGEHENFTRVVVGIPPSASWNVHQIGRTVTLSVGTDIDGFDTSLFFDLIPKDRISRVLQEGRRLSLELNCDCRAATFGIRNAYAVIDIASANTALDVPFIDVKIELEDFAQPETTGLNGESVGRQDLSSVEIAALNQLQYSLSEKVGVAATRGILDPSTPNLLKRSSASDVDTANLPKSNKSPISNINPSKFPNVRITSSRDLPNLFESFDQRLSFEGGKCVKIEDVALANWADERPFYTQVSELRSLLYGEFDRLDSETAVRLAKVYLHFGFGAEASQILSLKNDTSPETTILHAIADIIDGNIGSGSKHFDTMLSCEGDVALWALLSTSTHPLSTDFQAGTALQALNKIPSHLRSLLAPRVAEKLRQFGDVETAESALRLIKRSAGPLSDTAKIVDAQLAITDGRIQDAEATLNAVVDKSSEHSPEALITLIETQFENELPITPEISGLAAAYAQELEGGALGTEMQRANTLSLISLGEFDEALDALEDLSDLAPERAVFVENAFIDNFTAISDDVAFLKFAFKEEPIDLSKLKTGNQLRFSARLVQLGFPEIAQRIIASIPKRPLNRDRQIIAARVALSLDQPFSATAELSGLSSPTATQLLAQASEMAGVHSAAYAFYRTTNAASDSKRAAWLANDWDNLALQNDPVLGPIATISQTILPDDSKFEGMLARGVSALAESNSARSALKALLEAPDMQFSLTDEISTE